MPADPSRGRLVGVKDAVEWLWASQVTRLEGQCREQSMRLFMTACSLLPGFDTADGPRPSKHLAACVTRQGHSSKATKVSLLSRRNKPFSSCPLVYVSLSE